MSFRLVFLGPPGVGKGTQASLFTSSRGMAHISTGDILRAEIAADSELGRVAKGYIEKGQLLPDPLIIDMVHKRLALDDAQKGYILDGFPRTEVQARSFRESLKTKDEALDLVVFFSLSDDVLHRRIVGRRICPGCKSVFHLDFEPSPAGDMCVCGEGLVQRKDDLPEMVAERLSVYRAETEPVVDFYRNEGILKEVVATGTVVSIKMSVEKLINSELGRS